MRSVVGALPCPPDSDFAPAEVPRELRRYRQWVGWDYRPTNYGLAKVPYRLPARHHPNATGHLGSLVRAASTTDPSTWASYEATRHHPKIGFVFTKEDPFCGLDLDDCLDPDTGEMSLVARVAVRYCASYAEVSPSGRGVKIIVRGRVPGKRRQNRRLGVEMYDRARFFALTGNRLPAAPPAIVAVDLAPLYRWLLRPRVADEPQQPVNTARRPRCAPCRPRTDEEIIRKARSARNGARFERLWRGDTSEFATRDNEGHSEADLALCAMLLYWCDGDPPRVDDLFYRSGLCREKWRGRPDYRKRTIERAVATARR